MKKWLLCCNDIEFAMKLIWIPIDNLHMLLIVPNCYVIYVKANFSDNLSLKILVAVEIIFFYRSSKKFSIHQLISNEFG
jgi:hypothetical protein